MLCWIARCWQYAPLQPMRSESTKRRREKKFNRNRLENEFELKRCNNRTNDESIEHKTKGKCIDSIRTKWVETANNKKRRKMDYAESHFWHFPFIYFENVIVLLLRLFASLLLLILNANSPHLINKQLLVVMHVYVWVFYFLLIAILHRFITHQTRHHDAVDVVDGCRYKFNFCNRFFFVAVDVLILLSSLAGI